MQAASSLLRTRDRFAGTDTVVRRRGRSPWTSFAMAAFAASLVQAPIAHAGPMNEVTLASSDGPIRLDASRPVRVALPAGRPIAATLAAPDRRTVFRLHLERLSARMQPGTTFRVYLGVERATPLDDAHFVATINFFGAIPPDGAVAAPPIDLAFDVTAIATRVAREARADDVLGVAIVADDSPAAGSDAAIRSIRLSRR